MRRGNLNAGSKPVRNLWTNPGTEATGAVQEVRTNLCTNPRGINAFADYNGPTQQTITANVSISGAGVPANPDGILTATRVSYTVAGSNPGIMAYVQTAGIIYSMSCWVYHESISGGTQGWAEKGVTSQPSPPAVTQGVWQKIQWLAYTSTATFGFGFRVASQTGSGSYLITGVQVEAWASIVPAFFDGATAAAGDFTYAWTGTANASTSQMRGVAVTGVSPNPSLRFRAISSTDWCANGTKSVRIIPTQANDGTTTGKYMEIIPNNLVPGIRYRVSATMRLKQILAGTLDASSRKFVFTSVAPNNIVNSATPPNAVGVYQVWADFTAVNAAHGIRLYSGALEGNGDMWVDNIMITEQGYQGDFINPTVTPFSKWDGTANASTSVGYPPQFYDIAGKPDTDITGVVNTGTIAVGAFLPRSIYVVYEALAANTNYPMYVSYGTANSKGLNIQASAIGGNALAPRFDFIGGDTNKTPAGFTNGRALGRHVAAFAFNNGLTSLASCLDGAADTVTAFNPGSTGWDDGRLDGRLVGDGGNVRTIVYYAEHDRATRLAISRYLGNKYGAAVA